MVKPQYAERVAWITGASAGIGRALAIEVARQGGRVALSARRRDRLEEVAAAVEAEGGHALIAPCDVTDEAAVEATVAEIVSHYGRIDLAIANAGFSVGGRFTKLTGDDWRRQMETNVVGVAITARHALTELEKTGGRLVLVGSVAGMIAAPRSAPYAASKAAVRAMGQALAAELHGSGVSVTTVHPGFVESEIAQVDNQGRFDPSRKDRRPARLMWPADRAARSILRAAARRKREHVFTGHGKLAGYLGRHAPGLVYLAATRSRRSR
jgi:short-subunit dehydrogenase